MSQSVPTPEELKRKLLFTPLESKEALHDWIELFLGLDIPDCIVDESSNSTPMDSIWEIYDRCRRNEETDFSRILSYAARMSFKTLGASILEVLMVFHLGRSVAHMAAIEGQAKKSQEYVKKFLRKPMLRDFVVGSNQRKVEIVRYRHVETGESLSVKQWDSLPTAAEQDKFELISNYIVIVICTMQGANSEHVPFMVIDEVDVVANPAAYAEAQAIPDTYEGKLPVTLLTSTRKFNYGLVQKEIDNAHESGLMVRHWNIIDVTERCPESRHNVRKDDDGKLHLLTANPKPRIPIYRSDLNLRAISEREWKELPEDKQELYVRDEGFHGCLDNCKLFAVCKGRLATHQKSESKLLKRITQTQHQFGSFSPEMAKAQLLCWKPSTEGLIYPRLERETHMLTAAQIAEKITGDRFPDNYTKGQLIALLKSREVRWYAGMDFGFTHNFAVVIGARDGSRMFILDVISQPELDLGQMIQVCDQTLKPYEAIVFADPEDPGRIKTLRKAGYKIREAPKPKGSVVGGIEIVRLKMWPAIGQPELFFLAGDEGVELLFKHISQYHWETDSAGRITNVPDEENDDEPDALRYMIMNVFAPKGSIKVARSEERNPLALPPPEIQQRQVAAQRWEQVLDHIGFGTSDAAPGRQDDGAPTPKSKGKKGGFAWDMG